MEFLNRTLQGNSLAAYLISLLVVGFSLLALTIIRKRAALRVRSFSNKTVTLVDDLLYELIVGSQGYFLLALSLYFGTQVLHLSPRVDKFLSHGLFLIFLLQISRWGTIAIAFWIEKKLSTKAREDVATATSLGLIKFAANAVLYLTVVLLAINNLGFNITTLVAGLGVGGIAIALAVQNILGDLFASLTIVLDKPFVVGDFIVVGDFMGTIEQIGMKTTRVRSLSGEQLVFANNDLLQSRLRNFKRMNDRRVSFKLGVVYQSTEEMLRRVPLIVRKAVEEHSPLTRFERCHFLNFTNSSLEFEVVYWVNDADFNVYADVAHEINVKIFQRFNQEKIDFAYPTQTLLLQRS
jgi:small-conductance mechanosensitive channel